MGKNITKKGKPDTIIHKIHDWSKWRRSTSFIGHNLWWFKYRRNTDLTRNVHFIYIMEDSNLLKVDTLTITPLMRFHCFELKCSFWWYRGELCIIIISTLFLSCDYEKIIKSCGKYILTHNIHTLKQIAYPSTVLRTLRHKI